MIMYVDMNSFFASCEQQLDKSLRGKPVGVCPYISPNAAVIAASIEAKRAGIKTGMRLQECREVCPQMILKPARPAEYRKIHIGIMEVLKSYCNDVIPKSIDEAIMVLTSYKWIYKDVPELALQIKKDITAKYDWLKCSIGIAPNAFLAKLATDLQKPDGLIQITAENLDSYLAQLKLTDLPGIASANEKRLNAGGIYTPLELRYAPVSLLRKLLGGITGYYWHCRLNFIDEVDLHTSDIKSMGAGRMVSSKQSSSRQTMESLIIALCDRLEQRMIKQSKFCRQTIFSIGYRDETSWKTALQFIQPVQDATELQHYLMLKITEYEKACKCKLLNKDVAKVNITIANLINEKDVQYNLFDNKMRQDKLRKTMYNIKNKYGKNSVRKACQTIEEDVMVDAIGFGSVKDLNLDDGGVNNFLLE